MKKDANCQGCNEGIETTPRITCLPDRNEGNIMEEFNSTMEDILSTKVVPKNTSVRVESPPLDVHPQQIQWVSRAMHIRLFNYKRMKSPSLYERRIARRIHKSVHLTLLSIKSLLLKR